MAAISGRPDGRLANYIYDGGLGGVIDWRLGAVANDSPEEAAKVEAKVENGTYRGLEKLVKFAPNKVISNNRAILFYADATTAVIYGNYTNDPNYAVGKPIWFQGIANDSIWYAAKVIYSGASFVRVDTAGVSDLVPTDNGEVTGTKQTTNYWTGQQLDTSVSGEFNTQMVIGDPANILLTDALKDGWLGTWCPVIPNDPLTSNQRYPLSRKALGVVSTQYTQDNGVTWVNRAGTTGSGDGQWNTITNTIGWGVRVAINNYKAFAKQTKPSTNKPVYNAKAGLMGVFGVGYFDVTRGALLHESVIGKVNTSSASGSGDLAATYDLTKSTIDPSGKFNSSPDRTTDHQLITLVAPNNNSPAVKVLPYQISNNGQCSIGYQANELTWGLPTYVSHSESSTTWSSGTKYQITDGAWRGYWSCVASLNSALTSQNIMRKSDGNIYYRDGTLALVRLDTAVGSGWGDDSTIKVTTDGSDTFVDLNGNTNLSVVHELAIPYTWTSNHARAGEQVEGIDL